MVVRVHTFTGVSRPGRAAFTDGVRRSVFAKAEREPRVSACAVACGRAGMPPVEPGLRALAYARRGALGLLLLTVLTAAAAKPPPHPELRVKVLADREAALYAVGETAAFTVQVTDKGEPLREGKASWRLTKDGCAPTRKGTLELANPEPVAGTLAEPGFLQLEVTVETADGRRTRGYGGAGFEPEKLKPSMPVPEDFKAFWAAQKTKLSALPMNARLTPVTTKRDDIELFEVQLDCLGGAPVSGYFAKPRKRQDKTLPAILFPHAAGVRSSGRGGPETWAGRGALAMDFNAHGIPNGEPPEYYQALAQGELKGYPRRGGETPESFYFYGMFLRLARAIDFIATQPEWDGKHLVVSGGSQGGGQAVAAAGLDSRVSAISAHVPAICDHTGMAANRAVGWPRLIPVDDGTADRTVLSLARYFDSMNFGQCATARGLFSAGFLDRTCPPTSVYAMYNAYAGPKEIVNLVQCGHGGSPLYQKRLQPYLLEVMGMGK
ncbi:MAG: acetylxylan esterase [Kiritimatiellae bacterium]|nr:acetylxylan esterase [Kiritimatiellia bacterium]